MKEIRLNAGDLKVESFVTNDNRRIDNSRFEEEMPSGCGGHTTVCATDFECSDPVTLCCDVPE